MPDPKALNFRIIIFGHSEGLEVVNDLLRSVIAIAAVQNFGNQLLGQGL